MEGICYMAIHNHRAVKHFSQGPTPSEWGTQKHLTLRASILDHQMTLLLKQRGSKKIPAGPPFSWVCGADGWARAAITLQDTNWHTFHPVALLCMVSISNIISWSEMSAPILAITSGFWSLGRQKEEKNMKTSFPENFLEGANTISTYTPCSRI